MLAVFSVLVFSLCDAEKGLERGIGASGGVVEGLSGAIVGYCLGAGILFVWCGGRVGKRDRSKWRGSRGGE